MTVIATPSSTNTDLSDKYKVTDATVRARVNEMDSQLRDKNCTILDGFDGIGMGTERSAYYDPATNLVYKKRHDVTSVASQEFAHRERVALEKAHKFLAALPPRYADTKFHITPNGMEYMVQEYVPNAGEERWEDALTDEVADIFWNVKCAVTGLSRDYVPGNIGSDPVTGQAVLIDLLEIREDAWW